MTDFWNGRFKVFMKNMGHIMAVDRRFLHGMFQVLRLVQWHESISANQPLISDLSTEFFGHSQQWCASGHRWRKDNLWRRKNSSRLGCVDFRRDAELRQKIGSASGHRRQKDNLRRRKKSSRLGRLDFRRDAELRWKIGSASSHRWRKDNLRHRKKSSVRLQK